MTNVFPAATATGAPFQSAYSQRTGGLSLSPPPGSQSSSPMISQPPEVFVQLTVVELVEVPPDAALNEHGVPPAMYPFPSISWVIAVVAVGGPDPRVRFSPFADVTGS
jgi:hypothetical protein